MYITYCNSFCQGLICHFSDDIEVSLDIVLPGLPLLDAQFFNPQNRIHVHRLVTGKNPHTRASNGFGRAEALERGKEDFQVH